MRPVALRKQSRAFLHNHDVPLAPVVTLGLEHLGVETYDHSVVAAVQTRLDGTILGRVSPKGRIFKGKAADNV